MKLKLYLLFFTLVSASWAQDFDRVKLDSLFLTISTHQKGMGSLSIYKDGREVYQKAFGFGDIEAGIGATPTTKYRIGSVSKTFTAVMALQLIDEGKLTLDTRLSEFFPQFGNAEKITMEHLLRHQSGLYNFTNAPEYAEQLEIPLTRSELLDRIQGYGNEFEPGERSEYSNSNYVLLSLIVEEIEGRSFEELIRMRIAEPLQLRSTYYGSGIDPGKQEARSYNYRGSWQPATETDMSIPMGAGAIVSTPSDLNVFFHALFEGSLVTKKSLKAMTSVADGFGMGLIPIPFYKQQALGHTGGIDGFQSLAAYFPKERVGVAYTTNGVVMPMNDILIGTLSIYFGKPYELPLFEPGYKVAARILDQYTGIYSSPNFPLKVSIWSEDEVLVAQATGQPSFALEAIDEHKFRFEQAGLTLEFVPEASKMILKQMGGEWELARE